MAPIDDVIEFPESASTSILECLQRLGLGHEERRKLIIEAEALPFDVEQATALLPLLRRFIEEFRGSNVPAGLVAVGSAIRNYVAVAPTDEALEGAASLLRVDGRHALPIELEVETTKMVVRKLTANLPAQRERYCELAIRLEELIDDYTRPRFLAPHSMGLSLSTLFWGWCWLDAAEILSSSTRCARWVFRGSSSWSAAALHCSARNFSLSRQTRSSPTSTVRWKS